MIYVEHLRKALLSSLDKASISWFNREDMASYDSYKEECKAHRRLLIEAELIIKKLPITPDTTTEDFYKMLKESVLNLNDIEWGSLSNWSNSIHFTAVRYVKGFIENEIGVLKKNENDYINVPLPPEETPESKKERVIRTIALIRKAKGADDKRVA